MRKSLFIILLFCCFKSSNAQNVGIGTTAPVARLHVADSAVLFTGPSSVPATTNFNPPIQGIGSRLMWYPQKAAFRAGVVDGTQWNKDSIGRYSFATGNNTKARGEGGFATGFETTAYGFSSVATGVGTIASGYASTAMGVNTTASGTYSTAMGLFTTASGTYSTAMGFNATASGNTSTAMGVNTTASGNYSTAMGFYSTANGDFSTAMGNEVSTNGNNGAFIIGDNSTGTTTNSSATNEMTTRFAGGYRFFSDATLTTANAMVFNTGKLGIGINTPFSPLSFGNIIGSKISLFGSGTSNYGFGIQGGLLQIHTDAPAANIAFGSGSSSSFTERARIINQGEYGMTLKGRLQLNTGTQSAGLWMTNMANNQNVVFMGMAADNLTGFFGPGGAGWGLTMNTNNANVGIGLNGGNPAKPLSFPASLGEKILLFPGGAGEVGIGVYGNELRLHADNPGSKVSFGTQDNAGNFDETAKAQRNGAFAFFIFGNLWANGSVYASDERFKQNITPIQTPLQKLMLLNGVEYEMKTKEFQKNHFQPGRQMGLLAQNVEKIVPEAVSEKDGYKGVDYARLVPLLIESIKEQQQQINEQQKRVVEQQTQIETLQKLVKALIQKE